MTTRRILLLMLAALAGLASAAPAQDPVPLYPDNYKVLVENDRVRVLDFKLRKGSTEVMHTHPAAVTYVIEGFQIRFKLSDGRTVVRETKAGDVLFGEAVKHSPENIGDTDAHGILVELKGAAPADALTAFTFIHGIPGKEEELKRDLLALTAPTRAEPGNFAYDLYQSTGKPSEFLRFEVWKDAAALEAHKQTPHLKASFEKRKREGWTTEITLWKRVEP